MELDELKLAWLRMNDLLDKQQQMQQRRVFELKVAQTLKQVQSAFRPLYWGQILQIALGVAMILLAVSYWSPAPNLWYRWVVAIILHVYGITIIVMAGVTLGQIRSIDYSEPVVSIRRRVASLKSTCLVNGIVAGLPWWILWCLVVVVLASYYGYDLLASEPLWFMLSIALGVVGLLGTWMFHRWAYHPIRAQFGQRLDADAAGASISQAHRILNELREFEEETQK